jgi:hypothetical protein
MPYLFEWVLPGEKGPWSWETGQGGLCLIKGGNVMPSIIRQTKYGDTIFVSQPLSVASALVTWAVETYGLLVHSLKLQHDGYVKVDIPGLTSITYAPEGALKCKV